MKLRYLLILLLAFTFLACSDDENGDGNLIKNWSFENPSDGDGEIFEEVDDWDEGGNWWGRVYWDEGVHHGEFAVWSSFKRGGEENGFSQELSETYKVGTYTLTVWTSGDTDDLNSRIILGYKEDNGDVFEIDHSDMDPGQSDEWKKQELVVMIAEGDDAVGRKIFVRLTGTKKPSIDSDDSNWWDEVSLTYTE